MKRAVKLRLLGYKTYKCRTYSPCKRSTVVQAKNLVDAINIATDRLLKKPDEIYKV